MQAEGREPVFGMGKVPGRGYAPKMAGCFRFTIALVTARGTTCNKASVAQGMIPKVFATVSWTLGIIPMKTIGWAAIVYSVHDAYTFGALVLLIAGEIAVSYVS